MNSSDSAYSYKIPIAPRRVWLGESCDGCAINSLGGALLKSTIRESDNLEFTLSP
jgi:hypothetical protein